MIQIQDETKKYLLLIFGSMILDNGGSIGSCLVLWSFKLERTQDVATIRIGMLKSITG